MFRTVAFALLVALATADIEFTRTVTALYPGANGTVTASTGCKTQDQYGSNNCDFVWGSAFNVTINVHTPVAITTGATIEADFEIDSLISFKQTCNACGQNCDVKIPVIDKPVTITPPACPLLNAGDFRLSIPVQLPDSSPSPAKVSFKGTVVAKMADGTELISVTIDGSVE